nr:clan AA aspartic protease [Oceanococcus sp. HetDA_MAG_MS8]
MPRLRNFFLYFAPLLCANVAAHGVGPEAAVETVAAHGVEQDVVLEQRPSGGLYVNARIGAETPSAFLVDTGAGYSSISQKLFRRLQRKNALVHIDRVAARMADGRLRAMDIYQAQSLQVGDNCELGPVEVAVLPGSQRNILGMSALAKAAPFMLGVNPPSMRLSHCAVALTQLGES